MKSNLVNISTKSIVIMLCMTILFAVICPIANYAEDRQGKVIVKYQDKDGNIISEEGSIQGNIGDEYEVARKNIEGYKAYGVTPKTSKGTFTQEDIETVFVYQKIKDEEVVVKYIDQKGYYIRRDKTITGYEGDPYETTQESVDGYKHVKTTGKEKGEIEKQGKEIVYTYKVYDKNSKTEWTTAKTLTVIAIIVVVLIVIFIVIAKLERKAKSNNKVDEDNNKNSEE